MSDRSTQTFHAAQVGDDSSTVNRPLDNSSPLVPLRMRSESGVEIIEIDQPSAILGRHSEADVRIAGADVSRRHCEIFFRDGLWRVRDLSSLNGVFLNDAPVTNAALYLGDRLRLGAAIFVIERAAAKPRANSIFRHEALKRWRRDSLGQLFKRRSS